jgi:hypothetical protein
LTNHHNEDGEAHKARPNIDPLVEVLGPFSTLDIETKTNDFRGWLRQASNILPEPPSACDGSDNQRDCSNCREQFGRRSPSVRNKIIFKTCKNPVHPSVMVQTKRTSLVITAWSFLNSFIASRLWLVKMANMTGLSFRVNYLLTKTV